MNPRLADLHPYPFQRLAALLDGISPGGEKIRMSIGEPRHPAPPLALDALADATVEGVGRYPATKGTDALRTACAEWAGRRYGVALDPATQVVPCNGTREAIFALVQAVVSPGDVVAIPNPFYQIYEGAALLAGATPYYVPCTPATGWAPDFDGVPDDVWARCSLALLCTPHNPTGGISTTGAIRRLLDKADAHDVVVASDECYSEIYCDEPPPGLLQVCGDRGLERCVIFQSLSKRSSLPGLRSGFLAGGADVLGPCLLYRTYSGGASSLHVQAAAAAAWGDEAHVATNRALYRAKIDAVHPQLAGVLDVDRPAGGFFLWAGVPGGDELRFTRELFAATGVEVLPGSYLARPVDGVDPGAGRIRIALVAPLERCVEASERIAAFTKEWS